MQILGLSHSSFPGVSAQMLMCTNLRGQHKKYDIGYPLENTRKSTQQNISSSKNPRKLLQFVGLVREMQAKEDVV